MKRILVANWKERPSSPREVSTLLTSLTKKSRVYKKLSTFIAPPFPYLESVHKKVSSLGSLASQDLTSIEILKGLGVRLSIIGHSDRRKMGETNAQVSEKVKLALKSGITPLVCVGEHEHDTEGNYFEFISEELKESLKGIKKNDAKKVLIAYEPIWAIGKSSSSAMKAGELSQMVIFIRKVLADLFGRRVADEMKILYGGSVDPVNAEELVERSLVAGLLVGHESLLGKDFARIAEALS